MRDPAVDLFADQTIFFFSQLCFCGYFSSVHGNIHYNGRYEHKSNKIDVHEKSNGINILLEKIPLGHHKCDEAKANKIKAGEWQTQNTRYMKFNYF